MVTPRRCTTNWWLFPPQTTEVQFDEKWAFVGKKEEHCNRDDRGDDECGDNWDHVAFDPEHRLVLAVVPGKRTAANCHRLIEECRKRTAGRILRLMTSDDYPSYKLAIADVYAERHVPLKVLPLRRGRPRQPFRCVPRDLTYARICKTRDKRGRVIQIKTEIVFGSEQSLGTALQHSAVSHQVNTSFLERYNGTDRHHNARKSRKTYRFSKDWQMHEAMTYFTIYSYNFCWPVRTLARRDGRGRHRQTTPAMSAGLADHVWSLGEWLTTPAKQWW